MMYPIRLGDMESFVRQAFMWVLSSAYLAERPDEVAAIERAYLLENPGAWSCTDATRSGSFSAISCVTAHPSERPEMWARSIPSTSRRATASAARIAML